MNERRSTSSWSGRAPAAASSRASSRSAAATSCCSRSGPHLTAADFTRWEAKATHDLFWPIRFAPLPDGDVVAFLAGRCVGGTTTINTKVALRAHEQDVAKWHGATGLTNDSGEPFALADLAPYYDRVEQLSACASAATGRSASTRSTGASGRSVHELEPVTLVHRRQLPALRLLPAGLPDERAASRR